MPRKPQEHIEQYKHPDKRRLNNPPVGLVTPATDPDGAQVTYAFDPRHAGRRRRDVQRRHLQGLAIRRVFPEQADEGDR